MRLIWLKNPASGKANFASLHKELLFTVPSSLAALPQPFTTCRIIYSNILAIF
jgi:hypothetical protein